MATDSHFARTRRLDLHKPDTVIRIPRNFSPCSLRGLQNTKYSQFYYYACFVKADWLVEEVAVVFIRATFTYVCWMLRDFSEQREGKVTTIFVLIGLFLLRDFLYRETFQERNCRRVSELTVHNCNLQTHTKTKCNSDFTPFFFFTDHKRNQLMQQ